MSWNIVPDRNFCLKETRKQKATFEAKEKMITAMLRESHNLQKNTYFTRTNLPFTWEELNLIQINYASWESCCSYMTLGIFHIAFSTFLIRTYTSNSTRKELITADLQHLPWTWKRTFLVHSSNEDKASVISPSEKRESSLWAGSSHLQLA